MNEAVLGKLRQFRKAMESEKSAFSAEAAKYAAGSPDGGGVGTVYTNQSTHILGRYIDMLDSMFPELKD